MKSRLFAASIAVLATSLSAIPAVASDKTDVMAVVNKAIADFNKGDAKAWAASCADQTSIIDNIAPYRWEGTGACSAWWNAYQAGAKTGGITEGAVKIAKVRHTEVTGDAAYVVLTANYSDMQKGKPTAENGSSFALVLTKSAAGWRIASWSWAAK